MTFPVFSAQSATGYNLTRSLRFRSSASAYLNRTVASNGNAQKCTWSGWVKRGSLSLSDDQWLFGSNQFVTSGSPPFLFEVIFKGTGSAAPNAITVALESNAGAGSVLTTNAVYRDPSAWYHIVVAIDTTQATASNRTLLYVNGVQVTSFSSASYVAQNTNLAINQAGNTPSIGCLLLNGSPQRFFDGYMAEVNFIDGQALTPSSFGATNAQTGVWQPARYTGTYGTNGFYLPFTNNSTTTTLGNDFSGNGNNWTTNNISLTAGATYDSMTDVPTLTSATASNFTVLNPLITGNIMATSNANLGITLNASSNGYFASSGTIPVSSGKWYWENRVTTIDTAGGQWIQFGILNSTTTYTNNAVGFSGNMSSAYAYYNDGVKAGNGTATAGYGATFTNGDIVGVAFDADNGTITFYKNGVSQGQAFSGISNSIAWIPVVQIYRSTSVTQVVSINFGQQPFAYTPPTGFVALNTFNLPTPTIGATASTQANKYFDATLYTGTGSTQSIVNSGSMQPDMVWTKGRSNASTPQITDSVRGVSKGLFTSNTGAEDSTANYYVTAFNNNGFSVNLGNETNGNTWTYVGWQWKASNATAVTNTAGSITSTVSANTSAGFSVVTYTGNGSAGATWGHGLGVAPKFVIVKGRTNVDNWMTWHTSYGGGQYFIELNTTNARGSATDVWNNTVPSSTVVTVGTGATVNTNGVNYVAYCFSEVAGYSAFGSYTGNGSSDGPFVFTGFRPRFVMVKSSTQTNDWWMYDSARSTFNVMNDLLRANLSSADVAQQYPDFLSNGWKIRNTGQNDSGQTYIYMAFAENPFKYSLAR